MKPAYSLRQTCVLRGVLLLVSSITLLWIVNYFAGMVGGWVPHAASHLSTGLLGALVLHEVGYLHRQLAARASQPSQVKTRILSAGLVIFTLSQLVEAASAVIEYPDAGALHTISGIVALAGLEVVLLGMIVAIFSILRRRAASRWAYLALATFSLFGIFLLLTVVMGIG